jgi:hypothetical protein
MAWIPIAFETMTVALGKAVVTTSLDVKEDNG